jgi:hypothetical protein
MIIANCTDMRISEGSKFVKEGRQQRNSSTTSGNLGSRLCFGSESFSCTALG